MLYNLWHLNSITKLQCHNATSPRKTTHTIRLASLLVISALIVLFNTFLPCRLPYTDDAYFKEPAHALIETGKLASPALKGYMHLSPDISEVYGVYQPLYTLIYAVWIKAFPLSFNFAVAFDNIIRLILVVSIFLTLQTITGSTSKNTPFIVALTPWLIGNPARPDELAMALGYWGIYCLKKQTYTFMFATVAGLLLGLCAATSVPVLTVFLIFAGTTEILRIKQGKYTKNNIKTHAIAGSVCIITSAVILIPFYCRPGAWTQYQQMSNFHFLTGITRSLHSESLTPFTHMLLSSLRASMFQAPLHILVALTAIFLLARRMRNHNIKHSNELMGILTAYIFIAICLPQQFLYYWFLFPLASYIIIENTKIHSTYGLSFILMIFIASNANMRQVIKVIQIEHDQSEKVSIDRIASIIPGDAQVYASAKHYFLLRNNYNNLILINSSDWSSMKDSDYCVFGCWTITDVGDVHIPDVFASSLAVEYLKLNFVEISNHLPEKQPKLLGIPIGSHPIGFGTVIYKRVKTKEPANIQPLL